MSVAPSGAELLSVKETAKRLGVHENTVRNWVRRGLLPTAQIPGARVNRFDARDVERLRRQRGSIVSSVAAELRTVGPELVNATDLHQWAVTRDAQDGFPELVRRLLASTPGITNLSMRAGDGVALGGWDGRADASGQASFLPTGALRFELGVGRNPRAKAQTEYDSRSAAPLGTRLGEATFVFATPRRWRGAEEWARERRGDNIWADVRVLDADDLEGWLQEIPAVHYWLSEHLGRNPRSAETLTRWWERFQNRTRPSLPAALFLAGREAQAEELRTFLAGPPAVIGVRANWRDDALAFVSAAIESEQHGDGVSPQPPLVVSASDVWARVIAQPGRMTLLPVFDDPDIGSAQSAGHHVVVPFGGEQEARGKAILLPEPHRNEAAKALEEAGVDFDRAYQLAALARRSMASLIRVLAQDPRIARPPWAREDPPSGVFAPLALAGAWTASPPDRDVVSRLADQPWEALERQLLRWRNTDDPPFVQPSGVWHLASADEAFMVLRKAFSSSALERWHRIVLEVLLETDPRLDLPLEERPAAGLMGVERNYSTTLRGGLADGVALMGAMGDELLADNESGAEHARHLVSRILEQANADGSGLTWRSLADVLPLLAEAAPDAFLDAIHDSIDASPAQLQSMFQDQDQSSWLYSSSPHTGLLWALETLCWSPDYIMPATRALARLDEIDPGGRLSNRPRGSLASVLVPWVRHTAAPLNLRRQAVQQICQQLPEVGWRLLLALWPAHHSTSSPPSMPRHRDWKPEAQGVPIPEWIEFINELMSQAIAATDADAGRWIELADRLAALPPDARDRLVQALRSALDADRLSDAQKLELWEALRKEIGHHREFPTAEWSMDDHALSSLEQIADRLQPDRTSDRFAHLFDWRPHIPDSDRTDHETYERHLLQLRLDAVRETLEQGSVEGLRRLAERSPVPGHLGWTLAEVPGDELTSELLTWLDADNGRNDAARAWITRKSWIAGVDWVRSVLGQLEVSSDSRVAVVVNAVPSGELWDLIAETGGDLHRSYWREMNPWRVSAEDAERATRELLTHDRPWPALDLVASHVRREDDWSAVIAPAVVQEILDAALDAEVDDDVREGSLGYEIGVLLDYLEAEEVDAATLVRYEWAYFRVLEDQRRPRALFAALADDPSLFVELVSRVYRGKQEHRRELDENEAALANHSWWVLSHWRQMPGRRDDGSVDSEHLKSWVSEARLQLENRDRADIGDEQIGQVLAASPIGSDESWPHEAVREILEATGSRSLETGIHVGVVNARGPTTRGVYDGGDLERSEAAKHRNWAKALAPQWPRTARVLRELADSYERDARYHDAQARLTADTD